MEEYQLKGAVHVKHRESKPESQVAPHLGRQLEDVHAEVDDHHGRLLVHDQLHHAAVHPRGLSDQGGADVEGGAGSGAVGGLAVDGHVVQVVFHLHVKEGWIKLAATHEAAIG